MAEDVKINDVPGFPKRTDAIMSAAENLKQVIAAERQHLDKVFADDAGNGSSKKPMPIYAGGGEALSYFLQQQEVGLKTAADNAILGAKTSKFTFDRIQFADRQGAANVRNT